MIFLIAYILSAVSSSSIIFHWIIFCPRAISLAITLTEKLKDGVVEGNAVVPGKAEPEAVVPGNPEAEAEVPGNPEAEAVVPGNPEAEAEVPGKDGAAVSLPRIVIL